MLLAWNRRHKTTDSANITFKMVIFSINFEDSAFADVQTGSGAGALVIVGWPIWVIEIWRVTRQKRIKQSVPIYAGLVTMTTICLS
jgi:hypothetical protein